MRTRPTCSRSTGSMFECDGDRAGRRDPGGDGSASMVTRAGVPHVSENFQDRPLQVDIGLDVESGSIEVGALSITGTSFLSASTVGPGAHTVVLHIPVLARCRSISIRNANSY